jgi:molybdate transport system ATP-binding protein
LSNYSIKAEQINVLKNGSTLVNNISFELRSNGHLAITGPSGSGKTILGLALSGKIFFSGTIKYAPGKQKLAWVEQQHHFKNLSNTSSFYYQQRFNSFEATDAQTVAEYLQELNSTYEEMAHQLKINGLLNKPLIQLSNGENKKVQLLKALLTHPDVLILDQPFVGLDIATREYLHQLINDLAATGITIVLITQPDEISSCITTVIALQKGVPQYFESKGQFLQQQATVKTVVTNFDTVKLEALTAKTNYSTFDCAIQMKNVQVNYGDKKILYKINWEVKNGERWLLAGANGAGKSTLLSLITADNPQAYANELYLFDKKRGSGESIWDIKKWIGYLSPELQLFFESSSTSFETIASGLFDTIGLFRQLTDEQTALVMQWMSVANIQQLARKRLYELSIGEQRIVLLIRAFIKNPPLLILDEPCQGLDDATEKTLLELIDRVCINSNKTLIYVTHYANKRPTCVNKLLQLDAGIVTACGDIN